MQNAVNCCEDAAKNVEREPEQYKTRFNALAVEYIQKLEDFELRCSRAGAEHGKLLAEITELNDDMMKACEEFERSASDISAIKAARVEFRERTNPILSKSHLINRTRTWPQGHQGDFQTLEMAYKNSAMSHGIGYFLDKYMLSSALTQGVRERIIALREMLKSELNVRSNPRVLDVACGSCREIFELASEIKTSGAKFIALDLDEDALSYSLDRLTLAGLSKDQVELRKYNALRLFDTETAVVEFEKQDIIYSVGYFDYLPDDFLIKMLSSLYKLLNPGGKLIASFKDVKRYNPQIFHWLANWDGFLQRTMDDFERILNCAQIPGSALSIQRVDSGSIVFYVAVQ
jgi:SAM-dependent methyltransferase